MEIINPRKLHLRQNHHAVISTAAACSIQFTGDKHSAYIYNTLHHSLAYFTKNDIGRSPRLNPKRPCIFPFQVVFTEGNRRRKIHILKRLPVSCGHCCPTDIAVLFSISTQHNGTQKVLEGSIVCTLKTLRNNSRIKPSRSGSVFLRSETVDGQ